MKASFVVVLCLVPWVASYWFFSQSGGCSFEKLKGPVRDKGDSVKGGKMGIKLSECKELCNANSACESFVFGGKKKACNLKDKKLLATEKLEYESPYYFSVRKTCKEDEQNLKEKTKKQQIYVDGVHADKF